MCMIYLNTKLRIPSSSVSLGIFTNPKDFAITMHNFRTLYQGLKIGIGIGIIYDRKLRGVQMKWPLIA